MSFAQLPLGIQLKDNDSFESFFPGGNAEIVAALEAAAGGVPGSNLFLWGTPGSGRSHLLHALCHSAGEAGLPVAFLPLKELLAHDPAILEGLEGFPLVCIDDLDACAGRGDWEVALFHTYNRLHAAGSRLILTAGNVPQALGIVLPDLVSRLAWGMVYQVQPLDEEGKLAALQQRARLRGFDLPDEVGQFLLRRLPRDNQALFALLEQLDRASFAAQRKLTIPFVKQVLGL